LSFLFFIKRFLFYHFFSKFYPLIRILTKIRAFNSKQIEALKKAIKNNDQVFNEIYALPEFKKTLKNKHKITIDS